MFQYKKVVIKSSDPKKTLFFAKESFCEVTTCEDDCNRLFQNLKQNLVSSIRKTNFIDAEVRKLLKLITVTPTRPTLYDFSSREQVLSTSAPPI